MVINTLLKRDIPAIGYRIVKHWPYYELEREDIYENNDNQPVFRTFADLEASLEKDVNMTDRSTWQLKYCRHDCTSIVQQWRGMFPVSDDATGTIYVNRVCAECHGVQSFTHWSVNIACSEDSLQYDYTNILKIIRTNSDLPSWCMIQFSAPFNHVRYQLSNIFEENNLLCLVQSFQHECINGNNFTIETGLGMNQEDVIDSCESDVGLYELGLTINEVFINPTCLICNTIDYNGNYVMLRLRDDNTAKFINLLEFNMNVDRRMLLQTGPQTSLSQVCNIQKVGKKGICILNTRKATF